MSSETTIRVPLTVEDRAERADIMAGLVAQIEAVKEQAKEQAKEFREDIEALEVRLAEIARVLREGEEERRQMDLKFSPDQAAATLAAVGAAACTCEGGPEAEVKDSACPVHGVETRGENAAVDEQGPIPLEGGMEFPVRTPTVEPPPAEAGPEAAADFVIPEDAAVETLARDLEAAGVVPEVETIAPETPPVVDEFIKAQKSRRRRRAEA